MKKSCVALLAFTLTSVAALGAANAADIYRAPEPVMGGYKDGPVVQSWTGFYAGVNSGYGWSDHSDKFAVPPGFGGINPQGGFGGGQIGYNWQGAWFGPSVVLGIEADIEGSGIEDKTIVQGIGFKSNLDWFGTVRGRLGYTFGPSLLYATGGFAFGGIDNEIGAGAHFAKNSTTATGYTVGGGWEYKLTPAWSLKAEYQLINLGRNDPVGVNICTSGGGLKCEDDAFHTLRVGVNYHFLPTYTPLK
jgi:outer membrane immunogenic protein